MTDKCVFDGNIESLIGLIQNLLEIGDLYNCKKTAAKFVHDNFKEKKSYVPKCSACGATCWSNNCTRGSKRICKKCFEKTKKENENGI